MQVSADLIFEIIAEKEVVNHLELAKDLGLKRPDIDPYLDQLQEQGLISSIRPNGRKYFRLSSKGITESHSEKNLDFKTLKYSSSKNININNYKLFNFNNISGTEISKGFRNQPLATDEVESVFDYWNQQKELKTHRRYSKNGRVFQTYTSAIDKLNKLFAGNLFTYADDRKLLKLVGVRFSVEEIKKTIDNLILSLTDYSYYPANKTKILEKYKKINLDQWLYNPYSTNKCKSLFIKYLEPPQRIQAKSNVKCHSDTMLKAFKKYYDKDLTAADLDQTKKALNKLLVIWKKIPEQYTHTTLPSNLNQQAIVKLLLTFCEETLDYFSIKLFSQTWFWTNFNRHLVEQGYLEGE